jgi:hypothetical protein
MQGLNRKDVILWLLQCLMMCTTIHLVVGGGLPHHEATGFSIEHSPY